MIEDEEQTNPRLLASSQNEPVSDLNEVPQSRGEQEQSVPAAPPTSSQAEAVSSPASDVAAPSAEAEAASTERDLAATIQVPVSPMPESDDREATDESVASPQNPPESTDLVALPRQPTPPVSTPAPLAPTLPYMSVDDLLALNIVSDPQISPDNTQIAFSLQYTMLERDTTGSAIWLVSSAGGKANPPRRLTGGEAHNTQPRWSPDGRTLAFLSDRSGKAQLYLLSLSGGEARQISVLPQGVSEYSWHPSGKMLLAHSYWKPGDEVEIVDGEESLEENPLFTISTRLGESKDGLGDKQGRHSQLWLLPLEGSVTRLTSEPVDLLQSCWSPDGTELAFCANRRSDPDLSISKALWVLTLATGQLRSLTPEDGWAQMPAWSPDGRWLAYLYAPDQTQAGTISPWIVAARGDAAPQPAVAGAEQLTCQCWVIDELRREWLTRPQWYPDSQSLLVPAQERGQVHLYRLDRAANTLQRLTSGNGRYLSPQLSRDGQMVTMVRADWFTPGDIWCMDGNGQSLRKLTRINDTILQSHQLIRPRRVSWQSSDGLTIEGWLYLPPQAGPAKVPLILAPHGGPALAWGDSYVHEFQVLAGRGYAVLAPNPRGSAGYGEDFGRKALNDWGGDDWRDLLAGLDHIIATEPIDGQRLGMNGLSYGGYLTNWALTQTNRFKAAVSRNGFSSLESVSLLSDDALWFALSMPDAARRHERSPLALADRIATPLLLLHADQDLSCPLSEARQLFVALRKRKQPVELVRYHNTSHLIDWPGVGRPYQRMDRLRRTVEWFAHFV